MLEVAKDAGKLLTDAEAASPPIAADVPTATVLDSLSQFFAILQSLEDPMTTAQVNPQELLGLADHGLRLLGALQERSQLLQCDAARENFEQLSVPVAIWAAQHQQMIGELGVVVNALSKQANRISEPEDLGVLADLMVMIVEAVAPAIRQDPDHSNPGRPWRVLNLNLGIVATRSGDPQRMEAVFEQLLFRLPDDAPGFFDEGMQQMDIIGYPAHVRAIMEKYYRKTHRPTLH